MLPGVEGAAEAVLHPAPRAGFEFGDKLAVDVHLVPADLVDHDHGADGTEAVVGLPERDGFLVHGEGGNFGDLLGEVAKEGAFFLVHGHDHSVASMIRRSERTSLRVVRLISAG